MNSIANTVRHICFWCISFTCNFFGCLEFLLSLSLSLTMLLFVWKAPSIRMLLSCPWNFVDPILDLFLPSFFSRLSSLSFSLSLSLCYFGKNTYKSLLFCTCSNNEGTSDVFNEVTWRTHSSSFLVVTLGELNSLFSTTFFSLSLSLSPPSCSFVEQQVICSCHVVRANSGKYTL